MGDTTTIEISRENWRGLNSRKHPGDSFDDVIGRLLGGSAGQDGDGIEAECSHCGHSWDYGGDRRPGENVTCPACSRKTEL